MSEPITVYAVEAGSYSDYRVDSLWSTREDAEARANLLNGTNVYSNEAEVVERIVNDPGLSDERTVWIAQGSYRWTTDDNYSKMNETFRPPAPTHRHQGQPRPVVDAKPFGVTANVVGKGSHAPRLTVTVRAETAERAAKVLTERLSEEIVKLEQGYYGDMWEMVTEYKPPALTPGSVLHRRMMTDYMW